VQHLPGVTKGCFAAQEDILQIQIRSALFSVFVRINRPVEKPKLALAGAGISIPNKNFTGQGVAAKRPLLTSCPCGSQMMSAFWKERLQHVIELTQEHIRLLEADVERTPTEADAARQTIEAEKRAIARLQKTIDALS
jgi:DNA-binding transcriptional regulator GbsR (MarR family)